MVGGISRTVERDGWRFDIGGHRFFTKVRRGRGAVARDPARRGLPAAAADEPDLLRRQVLRLPAARPCNALRNLGLVEAVRCVAARTLWVRVRPPKDQTHFEGWVAARFGWRLYRIFFKTYTEKVWGVPATEIRPTGPRSGSRTCRCSTPCVNALLPKRNQKEITSLIEEFQYPKSAPG